MNRALYPVGRVFHDGVDITTRVASVMVSAGRSFPCVTADIGWVDGTKTQWTEAKWTLRSLERVNQCVIECAAGRFEVTVERSPNWL